mgnify:CR=1 FL=1
MALRRNKFEVGNFVQLKHDKTNCIYCVLQTFRDDTNDTFCYRLDGNGWVNETDLIFAIILQPLEILNVPSNLG